MDEVVFVDNIPDALLAFDVLSKETKIGVDQEGIDLCRAGKLCIIQVGLVSRSLVYIFDVSTLGHSLFDSGLKNILESPKIIKFFFDVRGDSDALWYQFQVDPKPVYDVQVACMKAFYTRATTERVYGLARMIETHYSTADPEKRARAEEIKNAGKNLFLPDKGGGFEVWERRPIAPALIDYAALDIRTMIALAHSAQSALDLKGTSESAIIAISENRKKEAVGRPEPAKGRHLAFVDFP